MSVRRCAVTVLVAAALPALGARTAAADAPVPPPLRQWASAGADVLDRWYDGRTGTYRTTGWWNSAHALETELVASRLRGDGRGPRRAATTFAANQSGGFRNDYYDDEGWWALTWVKAFDTTGDSRYLATARALFDDMAASWDDTCGGGVWWSRAHTYKNAVTNEVFTELAAQLARHARGADAARYRGWALRAWNWFLASGMLNPAGLVNDGLDAGCRNNGRTTWTYNQGVVLGAAADLFRLTGDREYLRVADRIADAATVALTGLDGILHEPCERALSRTIDLRQMLAGCGGDGPQFKGIFIRYLAALAEVTHDRRYVEFVVHNAVAIWTADRAPSGEFGLIWSGPFDRADAARQSSALACVNSAAELVGGDRGAVRAAGHESTTNSGSSSASTSSSGSVEP